MEWISVKDKLPDDGIHVLVDIGSRYPMRGFHHQKTGWQAYYYGGCDSVESDAPVINWMPMPEPPKSA
jgi:hypothetical protein